MHAAEHTVLVAVGFWAFDVYTPVIGPCKRRRRSKQRPLHARKRFRKQGSGTAEVEADKSGQAKGSSTGKTDARLLEKPLGVVNAPCTNIDPGVITSYSIHYTKLYEPALLQQDLRVSPQRLEIAT